MAVGMFGTGASALLAFQRALSTISHNVANVNTPGYSRQRVEFTARPGTPEFLNLGQGVDANNLRRLADSLVFGRQNDSAGEMGRLTQISDLTSRVDKLMSDPNTGLSKTWSNFFNAAKGVSSDPTSNAARNELLSSGQQLAARWQSLDRQLSQIDQDAGARLQGQVDTANQLINQIAELNRTISTSGGANASPDLLDQRDLRVTELAKLTGARAQPQDGGMLNVVASNGQPLVVGIKGMPMALTSDPLQANRMQISLKNPNGTTTPLQADAITGEIGGLMEFRNNTVESTRAELGRMATAFAHTFNAVQRGGVDYAGNAGSDFFSISPPQINAPSSNTGSATLSASVSDVGALTGNNVLLKYDGTNWSAARADTGAPVTITGTGSAGDPLVIDGVSVVVSGSAGSGDSFLLRPTADASSSLKVAITDPEQIAAAAPMRVGLDAGNLGSIKGGTTQITDPTQFASFTGANIVFLDANTYSLDGGTPVTYTPGDTISGNGWSLVLDGTPAAGDEINLSRTPPRSSDNSNAALLANVDGQSVLNGGRLSVTSAMTQLTSRVGSDARNAQLNLDAQKAIDDQITAERESVSGVNLDEEATEMLRYQQAYQAATQIISVADTMFQSLMNAVRN